MTRACGCSGGECCQSEAAPKRRAEKSRCCHDRADGSKLARLDDSSRREARLPCGCGSEGDCLHERGRLPCGCGSEGDCFHEKPRLPCGCGSEGDCLHAEVKVKELACGCKDEGDCLVAEKRACGCKSEGDCFRDEGRAAPGKLACGCASEGDCFHAESKGVSLDCGCKSEGDCLPEETKQEDSCCCASGKPCGSKMEEPPGGRRRLACGCKSEGDCFHEAPRQVTKRLACGCKSDGDCDHEVAKLDPCGLPCGCKVEGDCFHEVIKQIPARLACGCSAEGECFHEGNKKSEDYKDRKLREMLELHGPRTDEIYRTFNIPTRFMYPKLLKGYRDNGGRQPHPCYRTTSTDYGWFSPTVHTVPTTYYPRDYTFSVERAQGGMYQNCSLNTDLDKHFP